MEGGRVRDAAWKVAAYAASTVALLGLWHLASLVLSSPALPAPLETVRVLYAYLPELLPAFLISLYRVLAALAAASILAIPLGLALGRSPRLDALVSPALHILYPIPKVVLLPIFLVMLGLGDASKIALMAVTVFFQILVSVRDAAACVPRGSILAARSLGRVVSAHVSMWWCPPCCQNCSRRCALDPGRRSQCSFCPRPSRGRRAWVISSLTPGR